MDMSTYYLMAIWARYNSDDEGLKLAPDSVLRNEIDAHIRHEKQKSRFICIAPTVWGEGKTVEAAKQIADEQTVRPLKEFIVYKVGPSGYVNESGSLCSLNCDMKPEIVEEMH